MLFELTETQVRIVKAALVTANRDLIKRRTPKAGKSTKHWTRCQPVSKAETPT